MTTVTGTLRSGLIVPNQPLDWPDGAEVAITLKPAFEAIELRGMTEAEQGDTPEAIDRWIGELNAIPTPAISDEDWAAWEQSRRDDKRRELAHAEEREASIRRGLE